MNYLETVKLAPLMKLTSGRPETIIGLIDGPVMRDHPDLVSEHIRELPGRSQPSSEASAMSLQHGTYIAGILAAKRGAAAPAICPDCTLLLRPLFGGTVEGEMLPTATPRELAAAIRQCIEAGAQVLNLSMALLRSSPQEQEIITEVLSYAAKRGVLVVVAAGNQATMGGSVLTRHPWVIPVGACDATGKPTWYSNLGSFLGRGGLLAPGLGIPSLLASEEIIGLAPGQDLSSLLVSEEKVFSFGGTSIAAALVTGTIALLLSLFPVAGAAQIRFALTQLPGRRRTTIVPPLLNAWAAYQTLLVASLERGRMQ